jgi:hypothetical protein
VLELALGKRVKGCLVLSGLFCKSQGKGGAASGAKITGQRGGFETNCSNGRGR